MGRYSKTYPREGFEDVYKLYTAKLRLQRDQYELYDSNSAPTRHNEAPEMIHTVNESDPVLEHEEVSKLEAAEHEVEEKFASDQNDARTHQPAPSIGYDDIKYGDEFEEEPIVSVRTKKKLLDKKFEGTRKQTITGNKRMQATEYDRMSHQKLLREVALLKQKNYDYEKVRSEYPETSSERVRRAFNSRINDIGNESAVKPPVNHNRVKQMCVDGVELQTGILKILGKALTWNLNQAHTEAGIIFGYMPRVSIDFTDDGKPHSQAWLRDPSRPELSVFAFKIARKGDTQDKSLPFYPKIDGSTRKGPEKLTHDQVLEKQRSLAEDIVKVYNDIED